MKILMMSSLILSSILVWPLAPAWQHAKRDSHWLLASLTDSTEPSDYLTAPVKVDEVVKTIMATGTLIPSLNVEVGSVLSGQVSKLCVDFNDKVVKGQVLAELDDRTFALAVNASKAALESARSDINGAEARLERSTIDVQQATLQRAVLATRVERAKIALDVAEREFRRKSWLQERSATPVADVQDSQSRRDSAAAAYHEAQAVLANQAEVIEGARADMKKASADIATARANSARAEAQLQSARIDLERTKITSPVDGVIIGRSITEGQTLATSLEAKTLFTIAGDLGRMEINTRVDESDIAKIKIGQDATFTVDAFPGRTFHASVKQIRLAPQVVQNVVTYTVVLATTNPDDVLLPGMTVLAKIVIERTPSSKTVPLAALRFRPRHDVAAAPGGQSESQTDAQADAGAKAASPKAASLWVLRGDGAPKRISVIRGDDDGTNVIVRSDDLRAQDRIVVGENRVASAGR